MLSRLRSSLAYRLKWAKLGIYRPGSRCPQSVWIAGRSVPLSFPADEQSVQEHEFHKIVLEDCYRLSDVKRPVRTVLDIGANIGLFALAARQQFPGALIHCYEPNDALA